MNVPGTYPTVQAAIDAASIGDTVDVATGTYNEDVTLKSGICLEGAGVDQTNISKTGAPGISGDDVSYIIIQGLSVEKSGGNNTDGGGISLWGSNDIILQSCRLTADSEA